MNETLSDSSLSPQTVRSHRLLRETCGRVALSNHRVVVELHGNDAKGWLQSQITNELRNFPIGGTLAFCLCTITGHIEAICNLWMLPDRVVVTSDTAGIEALRRRVEKMVILEDVRLVEPAVALVSIQGPAASERLSAFVELPSVNADNVEMDGVTVSALRSNRTGYGGWILMIPRTATDLIARIEAEFEEVDAIAYRIACLEFGSPQFGIDTDSKTLLPEMGTPFESLHINYRKGCYLGQEILMRIHSRGHVNRVWKGLYLDGPVAAGDLISSPRRPEAGVITSAYESPEFGWIAGAFVRREVAYEGEAITVQTGAGPVEGEVADMPFLRLG